MEIPEIHLLLLLLFRTRIRKFIKDSIPSQHATLERRCTNVETTQLFQNEFFASRQKR